jgi:hypothetical protein
MKTVSEVLSATFTKPLLLQYSSQEVLTGSEQIQKRKDNLYLALILGTNYNKKVHLTVQTLEGKRIVEGVILALTDDFVIFKGGTRTPVKAVHELRIY